MKYIRSTVVKILYFIKKQKIAYDALSIILVTVRGVYIKFFMSLFRFFPINKKSIVVTNFHNKGYGDTGKSIAQSIIKKKLNYKIFWVTKNIYKYSLPKQIIPLRPLSIKHLYYLSTAKYWINNVRFQYGVQKRKQQFYIQTWHGGLGLKKIEASAKNLPAGYILSAKHDSKMIDVMISNSDYRTKQYQNNFWYSGKIINAGLPRNDIFFNGNIKQIKNKVKTKLKVKKSTKIILYAPTFRSYNYNYFDIDFKTLINKIKSSSKSNFIILLRLHPNIAKQFPLTEKYFVNANNYPDLGELMLASDLLISDYSSLLFDFIYTKKPIYLYAPDYKKYINERNFNFNYKKLPFSISYTDEELINNILKKDHLRYKKKLQDFLSKIKIYDDGHATERIINILEQIKGEPL